MSKFYQTGTLLAAVVCLSIFSAHSSMAQRVFALSGNSLVSFDAQTPSMVSMVGTVTGLDAGQMLAGIDFRPHTGELYGFGYNATTGEARVYTLNLMTAAATPLGTSSFTIAPNMGNITFDFNPTVDRIRLMGSNRASYRLHPTLGTLLATDGMLSYAATDVNAAAVAEISTGAYTNSYIAATSTALYNYDTKLNVLTLQNPPNVGTQNTIGPSNLTLNTAIKPDLDIWFDAATGMNWAFFVASTGTATSTELFTIDITTGAATLLGMVGMPVRDIAVQIVRMTPPLSGDLLFGLTSTNWLVSFDAANPGNIRTAMPVSGIMAGQNLVGLDFRPASGELYGLGYNPSSGEARLYTIRTNTAAATPVGTSNIMLPANLGRIGLDFNPTVDRIRVTSSSGGNFRLHPLTGALLATDGTLSFSAGDVNANRMPNIGTVGYTNNFPGSPSTTLYNYDNTLNVLTTQIPPNDGKLNTVGTSGIVVNPADPSSDMDIFWDNTTMTNRAYLLANVGTSQFDHLYRLNLTTGAAMLIGRVGNGIALTNLAAFVAPRVAVVCPPNVTVTAAMGQATAVATYPAATAASGCNDGLMMPATLVSGLPSGSAFPGGMNSVCFMATDRCGNTGSCCFSVLVNETPCDVKKIGNIQFEMLNVRPDAKGNKIMRVRVTNSGSSPLDYVAFQVQNGTIAVSPTQGATYTAASGNKYVVRSPNFSPFYSIRFKAMGMGILSGQSDIFEYTLPKLTGLNTFRVAARTADGITADGFIHIYQCSPNLLPPNDDHLTPSVAQPELAVQPRDHSRSDDAISIAPNPSSGNLQIYLDKFSTPAGQVAIYNSTGALMTRRTFDLSNITTLDVSDETSGWANGLYFIEISSAAGQRWMKKWSLQR